MKESDEKELWAKPQEYWECPACYRIVKYQPVQVNVWVYERSFDQYMKVPRRLCRTCLAEADR